MKPIAIPDHDKVSSDPTKEAFTKLFQSPDTHNDTGPRFANVGGVTVDITSAEYAAWYTEHYGNADGYYD